MLCDVFSVLWRAADLVGLRLDWLRHRDGMQVDPRRRYCVGNQGIKWIYHGAKRHRIRISAARRRIGTLMIATGFSHNESSRQSR
jgi:hypothetical protein